MRCTPGRAEFYARRAIAPGEELTVRAWDTSHGEAVFTTTVGDRAVIDQGLLRHC